jgi:hypothetical protein
MTLGRIALKFFGIVERVDNFGFIVPTAEVEARKRLQAALLFWPPEILYWPPENVPLLRDAWVQSFNEFPGVVPPPEAKMWKDSGINFDASLLPKPKPPETI